MKKKIIFSVAFLALCILGLRACSESEIRRTDVKSLKKSKINSLEYPWSISAEIITSVSNYKEAYDFDSNDWFAQFLLLTNEAQKLPSILEPLGEADKNYRCYPSIVNWDLKHDVCNYSKMVSSGFLGFKHNPSFCEAGCKQMIILWVNTTTGLSYIAGAPDYK